MKKEQLEVIRWTLDLADTLQEGLQHIYQRQATGHRSEETIPLFTDVVEAFADIESALQQSLPSLANIDELTQRTNSLREGMDWMTSAYEGTSTVSPLATLQFTLLPRFLEWHRTLKEALRPHLAS